jgi:hypothetical protein
MDQIQASKVELTDWRRLKELGSEGEMRNMRGPPVPDSWLKSSKLEFSTIDYCRRGRSQDL